MRIVVDMQGAQSVGSRSRGIGRYVMSLSRAMARNRGEHDIVLALSGLFPDTIEPIRAAFHGLLPQENIRVWDAPGPVDYLSAPASRREIAEHIREYFIAHLKPDMVLVSSLLEGLVDGAVTSIGRISCEIPTAVILYDLIPYIRQTPYLENPIVKAWYLKKLDHLRRADLLLSISESSRQECIRYLGFDERLVINISTAADAQFSPRNISPSQRSELAERYGLKRPLVMYTGGIDHRKNVEGLIRAYAALPKDIRRLHQLAIVCAIQEQDRHRLVDLAEQAGLKTDDLVITGFVPDEDLIGLYNLCTVFVFPSCHEGFGLPALEAMSCGAPVIASNTSGLPEVIGREDALFDPHNDADITAKLSQVLTDTAFRQVLAQHGLEQARRFSWDTTAKKALSAFEQWYRRRERLRPTVKGTRPKLAYVSPLPPERSGISDYSAELLPQLSRYYEIDVVVAQQEVSDPYIKAVFPIRTVDWFRKHACNYDRVLYQFGNSTFHQHMFGLLPEIPGVVVLHDFFLSGIVEYMAAHGLSQNGWVSELYASHGYEAVRQLFYAKDPADVAWRYPCNLSVLQHAQGIIVHSANSLRLAEQWYGDGFSDWAAIPLLRASAIGPDKIAARKALGFGVSDFLVCTFGLLGPTKCNQRLLQAWLKSRLAQDRTCHLVFVGENHNGDYGERLLTTIRRDSAERNIRITGWVEMDVFRQYLAAADVGVQLRTLSRGETSATLLDCMNYGVAAIVNANGSMADLDDDALCKLPDDFTDAQLQKALETLWKDTELRKRLGARAREIVLERHNPRACAEQYHEALERFRGSSASGTRALAAAIAGVECALDYSELTDISEAIARNMPRPFNGQQVLVDISERVQHDAKGAIQGLVRNVLREWLVGAPSRIRIEPVYVTENRDYRYARRFTLDFLNCPYDVLDDDPVEFRAGDILISLGLQPNAVAAQRAFYQRLRNYGVQIYVVVYDAPRVLIPQFDSVPEGDARLLEIVAETDGALCISKAVADGLAAWIKANGPKRQRPFKIEWFPVAENSMPAPAVAGEVLDALRGIFDDKRGSRDQTSSRPGAFGRRV